MLYDAKNFYVSVRCWESHLERMVANEMRRDNNHIYLYNDNFSFLLDMFQDRRNGYVFTISAIGGRLDGQVINAEYNNDFNPVWEARTGRFDGGWTIEAAVPFASLRYRPGATRSTPVCSTSRIGRSSSK